MKTLVPFACLLLLVFIATCDMRSETAKREMEKFNGTPTPTLAPTPTEAPIDPTAVIQVDSSVVGTVINVDGDNKTKSIACTKLDRVMINGNRAVVTIKGACRQIMINGIAGIIAGCAIKDRLEHRGQIALACGNIFVDAHIIADTLRKA